MSFRARSLFLSRPGLLIFPLIIERLRDGMDGVRIVESAMWLQSGEINSQLLIVFVGLVAAALLTQAVALIVMAVGAAKARKRGMEMAEELRLKLMPVIDECAGSAS